jgi:DNA adenine methylase
VPGGVRGKWLMGIRNADYEPPFPYFGGKSAVADVVWAALGDVANYVEPFFGSGAVLFLRPTVGHVETVNDVDGFVANFWRAIQRDSEAVAGYADNPVNEADLHARHLWLLGERERITDRLCGDPDFYDAKAAGWWAWGLCCWIGSGWCSGKGPWASENGVMVLRATRGRA